MDYFKELELSYVTETRIDTMDTDEEFVMFAGAQRMVYNPEYSMGILTRYLDKNWKRISPTMQAKIGKLFQDGIKGETESGCDIDQLKVNYMKQFLDTHEIPWPF
jgi:hypothetical protein